MAAVESLFSGIHILLCSVDPDADQAVLNDLLALKAVPAEPGRLILALPPAEIATHTSTVPFTKSHADHDLLGAVVYFMCDDLEATVEILRSKGVRCSETTETEFGTKTTIILPSGGEVGLYQPSHETAFATTLKLAR